MSRERITRRQKDISRLLRERKQIFRERLLANRKNRRALAQGQVKQK